MQGGELLGAGTLVELMAGMAVQGCVNKTKRNEAESVGIIPGDEATLAALWGPTGRMHPLPNNTKREQGGRKEDGDLGCAACQEHHGAESPC